MLLKKNIRRKHIHGRKIAKHFWITSIHKVNGCNSMIYGGVASITDEEIAKIPTDLYREGYEYYYRTHAHPNSTFLYTMSSLLDIMTWDAATNMDLINQILLMIAPLGQVPEIINHASGSLRAVGVPMADFMKLTKIPIVIYYGDNIPTQPVENPGQEQWRAALAMAWK